MPSIPRYNQRTKQAQDWDAHLVKVGAFCRGAEASISFELEGGWELEVYWAL